VEQLLLLTVAVLLVAAVVVGLVSRGLGTRSRDRQKQPPTPTQAPRQPQPQPPKPEAKPGQATGGTAAPPGPPAPVPAGPPGADEDAPVHDELAELVGDDLLVPALEVPEPSKGRLARLRSRLARSQTALGRGLLVLLSRDDLDEDTWEEIEETLIAADVGVVSTRELVERLRTEVRVQGARTPDQLKALLRQELLRSIGTDVDRSLHPQRGTGERPSVVLVVGVNGTGKTTTTGKLARVLIGDGQTVLLGAADTFRAAAADQLQTWGDRVGARTVRGPEGGDPASVAFDAVKEGAGQDVDCVLIDTAGRLHTKTGLMDELGKVKRVVEKQSPVHEVLLVLDATTGQNGLVQARVFAEVVDVTGIVLSKLDGTAKGGIVIAVQRELGVPVKLIGLGEGADDLAPFEPEAFVDALLAD
jgi:fused signal recognition particle receptor